MVINVSVNVSKIDNMGAKTRAGVLEYLKTGADRGFATYLDRMPVDRGNMQQNSYSPEIDGERVRYGTRNIPYAEAIDEGTPAYTPPLTPLKEWGKRVLGSEEAGVAVWHKIRERGIDPQPFSQPAREDQLRWYRSHSASEFIDREFR